MRVGQGDGLEDGRGLRRQSWGGTYQGMPLEIFTGFSSGNRGATRPRAVELDHGPGSAIVRTSPLDRKQGVLLLNLLLVTAKLFSLWSLF